MRLSWRKEKLWGREDLTLHDLERPRGNSMVGFIKDKTLSPLVWVWIDREDENLELPGMSVAEAKKVIKAMVLLEG